MKKLNFTPGPTAVPDFVWRAMQQGSTSMYDPEFTATRIDTSTRLKRLLGLRDGKIIFLRGGGTYMMEMAASALITNGKKSLTISTGAFGHAWHTIIRRFEDEPLEYVTVSGDTYNIEEVGRILEENPAIAAVFMQAADSSTGVRNAIRPIADLLCRRPTPTLLAVDAVLEAGISKINMEKEGIDILVGGSQKAFMLPEGMGYMALSSRALPHISSSNRSFIFDAPAEIAASENFSFRSTQPVHLILGMNAVLRFIQDMEEAIWYQTHAEIAQFVRRELGAMGFVLHARGPATNGVSVFHVPEGTTARALQSALHERGILVATGLEGDTDRLLRIGHFWGTHEWVGELIAAIREIV